MNDTVQRVKEKLDIAQFVGGYVRLNPAGKNLKGLCPFHKEKSPSFIVSPDRQSWHCFGCGLGGDLISFLMQYENVEFVEALKILADKAGVPFQLSGGTDQRQYAVLYDINQATMDLFKAHLRGPQGKGAYEYLLKRGLTTDTIEAFDVGLSGSTNDGLIRHLVKAGFSVADIERAGLAFKTERGTYWDRFRHRVMFPIANHFDKVVGFTGRILPEFDSDKVGKYVNSPETPIFNKSKILFGFSKAKNAIRERNQAVLVEGQMDLIMLHQDGVLNAVATSGTALTGEHANVLRRFTENIILSFDNDKAGKAAAERAIDLLEAGDFNVKVLMINDEKLKDPADVVKEQPGAMLKLIEGAVPAMEYYFNYYGIGKTNDPAQKKKSVRAVLLKIRQMASAVEQSHWLGELAVRTGLSQEVLLTEFAATKPGQRPREEERKVSEERRTFTRLEIIMHRAIAVVSVQGDLRAIIEPIAAQFPPVYQRLLDAVGKKASDLSPEEESLLGLIQLRVSLEPINMETIADEAKILVKEFTREHIQMKKRDLLRQIQLLERGGDQEALKKALEEYQSLIRG